MNRQVSSTYRHTADRGFITRPLDQVVRIKNLPYLVILIAAWVLKAHYSRADSDGLLWILWPVAQLTAILGDFSFQYEPAVGYVDYARMVIIAPGCAGINFLIVAFCLTGFEFASFSQTFAGRMGWIATAAICALGVTLCANTIRIVGAVSLYQADLYGLVVTPERVHRVFGMVVYLGALCGLHHLINGWKTGLTGRKDSFSSPVSFRRPIFWYLAVAVGIPVINGIGMKPTGPLKEHYVTIIAGSLIVLGGINLVHRVYARFSGRR